MTERVSVREGEREEGREGGRKKDFSLYVCVCDLVLMWSYAWRVSGRGLSRDVRLNGLSGFADKERENFPEKQYVVCFNTRRNSSPTCCTLWFDAFCQFTIGCTTDITLF